jgi:hypothetical protein
MLSARVEEMEAELQHERAAQVRLQVCGCGCLGVFRKKGKKKNAISFKKKKLPSLRPLFKRLYCPV